MMRRVAYETDVGNEALAEVTRDWPQRISHIQKATIVHDFRSATSTQAMKSFTCASCTERVRLDKRCERLVSDDILCNPAVMNPHVLTWFSEKIAYIVGSYIVTKSQQYRLLHCCSTGVHPLVVGDV